MAVIELERTFLARKLPENLADCQSKEIFDNYYPDTSAHPILRLRKNGEKYEMTKKLPVEEGDSSRHTEHTIVLTGDEFRALVEAPGRQVRKIRYAVETPVGLAEVDVFRDALEGLVLVDFEFDSVREKDAFEAPDFCGSEVTQVEFLAGGMLAGKSYSDIEVELKKYN